MSINTEQNNTRGDTKVPETAPPLQTNSGNSPSSGGIVDFVKDMFVDDAGSIKTGNVIGAVGMALLGGFLGSGAGWIGALVGGLGGLAGGALAGPLIQNGIDFISEKVFNVAPSSGFARTQGTSPSADTVTRTQQPFVQIDGATEFRELITPNLDRFKEITAENATRVSTLEQRRHDIMEQPHGEYRQKLIRAHLSEEGAVQQWLANAEEWNRVANDWNNGIDGKPSERSIITQNYEKARGNLGFAPNATGTEVIGAAPTGDLEIPEFGSKFNNLARKLSDEDPLKWDQKPRRERLMQGMIDIDQQIESLRPGGSGGVDWAIESDSWGRWTNNTVSVGGYVGWWDTSDADKNVHHLASSWQDCKTDCVKLLRNSETIQPSGEVLEYARAKAIQGRNFARDEGDKGAEKNFGHMLHYIDALEAREQGVQALNETNQRVSQYARGPASEFQGYVEHVQGFRNDVDHMNQQIVSLNQNQIRIIERGMSATPSDDDKRYITVQNDANNSIITMVAEKNNAQWNITHRFNGNFEQGKVNDANRLSTPMPVSDIFTDKGIMEADNLGAAIKKPAITMAASLGISNTSPDQEKKTDLAPGSEVAPTPAAPIKPKETEQGIPTM
jgi:hypothetical protein